MDYNRGIVTGCIIRLLVVAGLLLLLPGQSGKQGALHGDGLILEEEADDRGRWGWAVLPLFSQSLLMKYNHGINHLNRQVLHSLQQLIYLPCFMSSPLLESWVVQRGRRRDPKRRSGGRWRDTGRHTARRRAVMASGQEPRSRGVTCPFLSSSPRPLAF